MQTTLVAASFALLAGGLGLTFGDLKSYPPESAPAVRLSSAYLADDSQAAGDVRLRLEKIGYPTAALVFNPALERDSASSTRWIDVAEVALASGDKARADYCYRRAASLAPDDPSTLFAVGDFYVNAKDARRAIPYLAHILSLARGSDDDILVNNILVYYDRLNIRQLNLVDQAIPTAGSADAWLRHLMATADPAAVRDTFQWMRRKKFDDDAGTARYVHYLFGKGQLAAAGEDWALHFAARNDGFPAETRTFNPSFEYLPTGSELDWRDAGYSKVLVTRDEAQHHDGRFSMRFDFTGNDNPDLQHFGEAVYAPAGQYRLEGFVKTAGITSSEGVRLRVTPYQSATILAETEGLTGTNSWTSLSAVVNVPQNQPMLQVSLVRHRSLRIDNQFTGRAWLDSVRLSPIR